MRAFRIPRPKTAFSVAPCKGRRRPREKDDAHLRWIRTLPCLVTGSRANVEAAHVRYGDPRFGKRETGLAEKPHDRWAVPLARDVHRGGPEAQHSAGERSWWAERGIDPVAVAAGLWGVTGDDEAAEQILQRARQDAISIKERPHG